MTNTLMQKRWFKKRSFSFNDKGLSVNEQSLFRTKMYEIPLEDIEEAPTKINLKSQSKRWLILSLGVVGAFTLYSKLPANGPKIFPILFYGSIAIIGALSILFSEREYIVINTRILTVLIEAGNPSHEEVILFLDELYKARNKYFEKIFSITPTNVSYTDELFKLYCMLKEKVISEEEFEKLKESALLRLASQNNRIFLN
ncbi:MAG: hypothetical protein Q8933_20640 [Bacteroidota bacterium]|nr:hypothetical protein [Bacteroidota bacterium]MDP4197267.1 hypothetical protein [Bacteroidota bacterium]